MDNNTMGCFAEYLFCAECTRRGYTVSMPILDSSIYDCIVDVDGRLFKVQIKSSSKTPDKHHRGVHMTINNAKRNYPIEDVDYFAFYVFHFDGFFVIKNRGGMQSIRLHPNGKYSQNFNKFVFV